MGKLLDEMWDEYSQDGYTGEELHHLMTYNIILKELTGELTKEQFDKLMKNDEESRYYHRELEKKAFLEGVRRGCLMMLEKM